MNAPVNLLSPEMRDDPYPIYADLRANAPVTTIAPYGWHVVTRYDDVVHVLKTPESFSSERDIPQFRKQIEGERLAAAAPLGDRNTSLISSDPPDHTRLRKLVSGAFTPRAITRLEQRVKDLTTEYVDHILEKDAFDMIEDLAIPLPVTVIAEMLGIDPALRADFKRWSDDTLGFTAVQRSEEEIERVIESRKEFAAFMREMIEDRRKKPREDLISDLVRAEVESDMLTSDEVFSLVILLLIAGNETTTNLIGNGTLLLVQYPEVLRELQKDPSLIPAFIEEVLRFEGPVRGLLRRATRDVELGGVTIPEGATVMPLLASANRDPAIFADPERFDIRREPRTHVAFGYGIHFCVGAPLSRLEGRLAFEEIVRRLPAFHGVEDRPRWNPSLLLHGLVSLPLRLSRPTSKTSRPVAVAPA